MANNNDTVRRPTWDERRSLSAQIISSESCRRPTDHSSHSMFLNGVDNPARGLHDGRPGISQDGSCAYRSASAPLTCGVPVGGCQSSNAATLWVDRDPGVLILSEITEPMGSVEVDRASAVLLPSRPRALPAIPRC